MLCLYSLRCIYLSFFFNATATTEIYTLSLHDALPICSALSRKADALKKELASLGSDYGDVGRIALYGRRSEEHTSELQSLRHLVCRLLLEKKKLDQSQGFPGVAANDGVRSDVQLSGLQ